MVSSTPPLPRAADQAVGRGLRGTDLYALAYRRVEHKDLRALCQEYAKDASSQRYRDHLGDRDVNLVRYAGTLLELYRATMLADYDPTATFAVADAQFAVRSARAAFAAFDRAERESKRRFPILLHFPPR